MPDTAFNPDDINTMTSDGQRWHEPWVTLGERLDGVTKELLLAMAKEVR